MLSRLPQTAAIHAFFESLPRSLSSHGLVSIFTRVDAQEFAPIPTPRVTNTQDGNQGRAHASALNEAKLNFHMFTTL